MQELYALGRPVESGEVLVGGDGTLYLAAPKIVVALRPDGSKKWELPLAQALPVTWALGKDRLYVASTGADYDPSWRRTSIAYRAELQAINFDGNRLWSKIFDVVGDLVLSPDGTLYAAAGPLQGPGGIQAISPGGAIKWTYTPTGTITAIRPIAFSDDVLFGIQQYFGGQASDPKLLAIDSSGRLQASVELGPMSPVSLMAEGGRVYVTGTVFSGSSPDGSWRPGHSELHMFDASLRTHHKIEFPGNIAQLALLRPGVLLLLSGPPPQFQLSRVDFAERRIESVYGNVRDLLPNMLIRYIVIDADSNTIIDGVVPAQRVPQGGLDDRSQKYREVLLSLTPEGHKRWLADVRTTDGKGSSQSSVSVAADGTIYIWRYDGTLFAVR